MNLVGSFVVCLRAFIGMLTVKLFTSEHYDDVKLFTSEQLDDRIIFRYYMIEND